MLIETGGITGLRRSLMILAAVAGLALLNVGEAGAGVTMEAYAKGSVSNLVTIQARYDALEAGPVAYLAGTISASINGAAPFDAYCVDLYDVLYVGGPHQTFEVNPRPISQLGPPGGNGDGVGYLYATLAPLVTTDIQAAALQVAIWKVEYDNGGPLTSGHFTVQDSGDLGSNQHKVFAAATADLATYNGTQSGPATWYQSVTHPFNGTYYLNQDLIGPNSFRVATPEPGTLASGLLGLSMAAGFLLRRTMLRSTGRI